VPGSGAVQAPAAGLRGPGLAPVKVAEQATGWLAETVDEPSAHPAVHEGAVCAHQGNSYLVRTLDLHNQVALIRRASPARPPPPGP